MRNVTIERRLDAPSAAVWAVLADYPNIASWNAGVKVSHSTSEATEGVGATRHCDLAPFGALEETIRAWEPETRLVISIDEAKRIPIKQGEVEFRLVPGGDATDFTLSYDYQPKYGPVGALMGPLLDRQLRGGFGGFVDDLEAAAKGQPAV